MNTQETRGPVKRLHGAMLGLGVLLLNASASAQYAFDALGDDHHEEVGVRYFGSAKDEKGTLLADVTFLLETEQSSFVFVTDADGRFNGTLPLNVAASAVTAKCWKDGLQSVRVTKRLGPKSAQRQSVQVDCVLKRALAT